MRLAIEIAAEAESHAYSSRGDLGRRRPRLNLCHYEVGRSHLYRKLAYESAGGSLYRIRRLFYKSTAVPTYVHARFH